MKPLLNHDSADTVASAEATLRLIATLPPPDGLADRVKSELYAAPRTSRLLSWPAALIPAGGWMHSASLRGAAAAAIVCVVAGGGWRIYSHVQTEPAAHVIAMPARIGPLGGFSSAGAMRTPNTLKGPVLTHMPLPAAQDAGAVKMPVKTAAASANAPRARKSKKQTEAAPAAPEQ